MDREDPLSFLLAVLSWVGNWKRLTVNVVVVVLVVGLSASTLVPPLVFHVRGQRSICTTDSVQPGRPQIYLPSTSSTAENRLFPARLARKMKGKS